MIEEFPSKQRILAYVKTSASRPAYVKTSASRPAYVKTSASRPADLSRELKAKLVACAERVPMWFIGTSRSTGSSPMRILL